MTDEEYIQSRLRAKKPYEDDNPWSAPDRYDRPAQFQGMDGGNGSNSLPQLPVAPPLQDGGPSEATDGVASDTITLSVDFNGTLFDYAFDATEA